MSSLSSNFPTQPGATGDVTGLAATAPLNVTDSGGPVPTVFIDTAGASANDYLKYNGTSVVWAAIPAGGVAAVTASAPLASSGGGSPNISLTGIVPQANGGLGVDASALSNGVLVKSGGVMSSTTAPTMSGANISAGTIATASLDTATQNRLNPAPPAAGAVPYSNGTNYSAAAAGTSSQVLVGGTTPAFGSVPAAAIPSTTVVAGSYPATGQISTFTVGADGRLTAAGSTTNGSALASLNASNLASGTVDIARIPTGTTSSTVTIGNDARLNPAPSAAGRTLYDTGSAWAALPAGSANALYQANGAAPPSWVSALTGIAINGSTNTLTNIGNASLTNSSLTVSAGTGLTGGGAVSLGGSTSLAVAYGTTAGTAAQGNDTRLNPTPSAAGRVPYDNGTGYTSAAAGTSSQLLHGGTTPSFGAVALGSEVSGTLPASNGGTGNASYAAGDLLYASGTTTLSRLATGTATQVLHGGATPSYGPVSLTADVSGVLPVANGGTGSSAGTTSNVITGLTLFATPVSGEIGYASGNNTVSRAIATSLAAARAVGVYTGTANTLSRGPRVGILLEAGLNSGTPPAAGQPIFVSATTAGRGTNVAPSTATQVEAQVAILLDATGYNNATGSVQDCAWQVLAPIAL